MFDLVLISIYIFILILDITGYVFNLKCLLEALEKKSRIASSLISVILTIIATIAISIGLVLRIGIFYGLIGE